jgi:hypothetical protein
LTAALPAAILPRKEVPSKNVLDMSKQQVLKTMTVRALKGKIQSPYDYGAWVCGE